jgi:hypothetical protein
MDYPVQNEQQTLQTACHRIDNQTIVKKRFFPEKTPVKHYRKSILFPPPLGQCFLKTFAIFSFPSQKKITIVRNQRYSKKIYILLIFKGELFI